MTRVIGESSTLTMLMHETPSFVASMIPSIKFCISPLYDRVMKPACLTPSISRLLFSSPLITLTVSKMRRCRMIIAPYYAAIMDVPFAATSMFLIMVSSCLALSKPPRTTWWSDKNFAPSSVTALMACMDSNISSCMI